MGETYPRVIQKLSEDVPKKYSRNEFCRRTGINPNSFDRYMAGISEPTGTTLKKLADFWGVSVQWLRGEPGFLGISAYGPKKEATLTVEMHLEDLNNLLEIYNMVPERLKDTLGHVILSYREYAIVELENHGTIINKKTAKQLEKVINEAANILEKKGFCIWRPKYKMGDPVMESL